MRLPFVPDARGMISCLGTGYVEWGLRGFPLNFGEYVLTVSEVGQDNFMKWILQFISVIQFIPHCASLQEPG
jgi:hypothetical protein